MDVVVKAFMGVFFSMILVFLGVGIISASMEGRNANTFASECTTRISNSGFSQAVIEVCKRDAKRNGYELQVWTRQENTAMMPTGEILLTYHNQIPLLGLEQEHQVRGIIY